MKTLLTLIALTFTMMAAFAEEVDGIPRWLLLGDDDDLKQAFTESEQVVLVCLYATTLEEVRPPFAMVVHHATVVKSLKGDLEIGEKIEIAFHTDSLPESAEEREPFIRREEERDKGDLTFIFLFGGKRPRFDADFTGVPDYSKEMADFLDALVAEPAKAE